MARKADLTTYLVPPRTISLMTGVRYASQPKAGGPVTLTYLDGTEETASVGAELSEDMPLTFFQLVSTVQTQRA